MRCFPSWKSPWETAHLRKGHSEVLNTIACRMYTNLALPLHLCQVASAKDGFAARLFLSPSVRLLHGLIFVIWQDRITLRCLHGALQKVCIYIYTRLWISLCREVGKKVEKQGRTRSWKGIALEKGGLFGSISVVKKNTGPSPQTSQKLTLNLGQFWASRDS